MKALVWHATGDIRLDEVAEPQIEQPTDAVIRLTASAIRHYPAFVGTGADGRNRSD